MSRLIAALALAVSSFACTPTPTPPNLFVVVFDTTRVDRLPPQPPRGLDSLEQAAAQLSSRLYLGEGSVQRGKLERVLREALVERDGVFVIRGAKPLTPTLVSWQPSSNAGS